MPAPAVLPAPGAVLTQPPYAPARRPQKRRLQWAGSYVGKKLDVLDQALENLEEVRRVEGQRARALCLVRKLAACNKSLCDSRCQDANGPVKLMLDAAMRKTVLVILGKMGKIIKESCQPAYAPTALITLLVQCYEDIWPEFARSMEQSRGSHSACTLQFVWIRARTDTCTVLCVVQEQSIMEKKGLAHASQREFELMHWSRTPTFCPPGYKLPPRPLEYFRARLLYALYPADGNSAPQPLRIPT